MKHVLRRLFAWRSRFRPMQADRIDGTKVMMGLDVHSLYPHIVTVTWCPARQKPSAPRFEGPAERAAFRRGLRTSDSLRQRCANPARRGGGERRSKPVRLIVRPLLKRAID